MSRLYSDTAFEHFWSQYPKKVGKLAAKREWDRIRPTAELVEQMMATLAWQVEQWDDPQYIPHPRTWLYQGRWDDELPKPRVKTAHAGIPDAEATRKLYLMDDVRKPA
jgi:hypothetical protein